MTYKIYSPAEGFPAKAGPHGALGWSSVLLAVDGKRVVILDTGGPSVRSLLIDALARLGIRREDVTHVLLTHFHWDHVSNVTLFPHARVVVSHLEAEWARGDEMNNTDLAELHVQYVLGRRANLLPVRDGEEILPGIVAIATPGHTPGHLSYRVAAEGRDIVFAGDAVKNLGELTTGDVTVTMDAAQSRRSVGLLRGIVEGENAQPTVLYPGHDVHLGVVNGSLARLTVLRASLTVMSKADVEGHVVSLVHDHGSDVEC